MKIGDEVISTKVRPTDPATIIDIEVVVKEKDVKPGKKKSVRTKYKAKYSDGSELTFYGFNIGKSIFKFERPDGQLDLSQFMNYPEE